MPTGYTACIDDGGSFADYVWSCSRAFIRNGDDNEGRPAEIPYYRESVAKSEAELQRLSKADPVAEYKAWFEAKKESNAKYLAKNKVVREKYNQMRMRVSDWVPPSELHENMKKFMLEQLATGMESDMSKYWGEPEPQDPYEWHAEQCFQARERLERARESLQKHLEWVEAGQKWVDQLEASVPKPVK